MGPFAMANGFDRVVDRLKIEEKTFATAWGQCDEDTFNQALKEFDAIHAKGKPFFAEIVTVSNHRPYTFPEGKGNIRPKLQGKREGAVRYADHAVGEFLRKAEERPFFRDTVFVIVADHWARVSGKQEIPMYSYHIPILLYAPGFIAPGRVDTPGSQMDLAPTLLGLLNFSYVSTFMGRDLLKIRPEEGRLLVSHNHDVGYCRDGIMVVLGLKKTVHCYDYDLETYQMRRFENAEMDRCGRLLEEAVAYFQTAYHLYDKGLYRIGD
jgi:phosphoglycerol transferase MdoB-like AlkP superfamily enzyme